MVLNSFSKAFRTVAASRAFKGTRMMARVVRSTSVPIALACSLPTIRSPSQCPGISLPFTSSGRSFIDIAMLYAYAQRLSLCAVRELTNCPHGTEAKFITKRRS